ncbi:MAG: flagellar biosynthesis anti-sigma factor FlgM [Gammaproteobacteria bacterium]
MDIKPHHTALHLAAAYPEKTDQQANANHPDSNVTHLNTHKRATSDRLQITDTSRDLQNLEKLISSQPDIDNKHIDSIRLAINEGRLNNNPQQIAERLIGIETELGRIGL